MWIRPPKSSSLEGPPTRDPPSLHRSSFFPKDPQFHLPSLLRPPFSLVGRRSSSIVIIIFGLLPPCRASLPSFPLPAGCFLIGPRREREGGRIFFSFFFSCEALIGSALNIQGRRRTNVKERRSSDGKKPRNLPSRCLPCGSSCCQKKGRFLCNFYP